MASFLHYLLLSLALTCLVSNSVNAKTIFRRTDKISDNFKQLNLPAEEIDPNVAPPEPQKVETIDPEDVSSVTSGPAEEVLEEVEDAVEESSAGANDLIDDTLNEVDTGSVAAPQNSGAAPAVASSAASSSSSSSSSASATPAAATTPIKNEDDPSAISKYCKCSDSHCDCCRDFGLPLIPVRGPGCAKITYLGDQKMSVSIKYGDITLATRTISGKKARPVCVGLPGGYSQFCGRVYGLSKAKENFKACLGFELRADDDVEASLRVSCFKFGPEGLRVAEPEPLPSEVNKEEDEDDDDIFGFGAGGDDEDDEDYDDEPEEPEEADSEDDETDDDDYPVDEVEPPADADYGGFSLGGLIDELTDDDDDETTPVKPAVTPAERTPAAVSATRAADKKVTSSVQSKDDKGTEGVVAAVASDESSGHSEAVGASVEEAVVSAVTPATVEATTVKSKKSKKAKKNKKKKAASADSESGFAYELLNGILDFFN